MPCLVMHLNSCLPFYKIYLKCTSFFSNPIELIHSSSAQFAIPKTLNFILENMLKWKISTGSTA